MLILFDHGAPRGLARALSGHTVITAKARGWDRLTNGALLNAAEAAEVDLLLTTDQGIRYQQNLAGRKYCDRGVDRHNEVATRTVAAGSQRRGRERG